GAFSRSKASLKVSMLIALVFIASIYLYKNFIPVDLIYGFSNLFVSDQFIIHAKILVLIAAIIFLFIYIGQLSYNKICNQFEFPILVAFSVVGMLVLLSANNFMSMYVGVELQALAMYVMAAF